MPFPIEGWKKVYLIYGSIFFGLGLLGFFFNNGLGLPRLARLALVNVSRELADLGLIPSEASREVTVSNPGFRGVVFIDTTGKGRYVGLKEQILNRIKARTDVISYPVAEREWYKAPQSEGLLTNGRLLVGLDLEADREGLERPSIVFSLSKEMTAEFLNRIISHQPELPLFKLELIWRGQTCVYRFSFKGSENDPGHLMKGLEILLDLWETGGRNLQRGNYRETFW